MFRFLVLAYPIVWVLYTLLKLRAAPRHGGESAAFVNLRNLRNLQNEIINSMARILLKDFQLCSRVFNAAPRFLGKELHFQMTTKNKGKQEITSDNTTMTDTPGSA